jgi:hypothetical protein
MDPRNDQERFVEAEAGEKPHGMGEKGTSVVCVYEPHQAVEPGSEIVELVSDDRPQNRSSVEPG